MCYTWAPYKHPAMHDGINKAEARDVMERQRRAVWKAQRNSNIPHMLFVVHDLADDKRTMGCGVIRELIL